MNPLLHQRQLVMQKQMLEHQARMVASRQHDMLGAAWFDAEARKVGMRGLRSGTQASPAKAAKRGWPVTQLLLWVVAALAGVRLLAGL
jgi:hypothetical protein